MKLNVTIHPIHCIKTSHVYPPIPIRSHDWAAWCDDLGADCSPYGYGATEQEAIDSLLEQIEEMDDG